MRTDERKTQGHTRAQEHKSTRLLIYALMTFALLLGGCTNWKKKYEALNVEHQNVKGLLERATSEREHLDDQVSQGQQTIEELQRRIAERQKTAAEATGFGEGYDVAFDPTAGTITVTLPNTILFDSGKAVLKKATSVELDHIRSVLQSRYGNRQIDVVGHTDTDPIKKSKWKDNWELSAQRALSVVRYLAKRGISRDKVRAVGCGESRPIASNSTVSGKAKNRRVEIIVRLR